jgi:hypothetical protein
MHSSDLLGGATNITTDANGNINREPSDQRLKKNVKDIENALDTVLQLRGVTYEWKDDDRFGRQEEVGFLAQEVDPLLPQLVSKGGEYWSLNTKNIAAVLVEALKDLHAEFIALRDVVTEFATEITTKRVVAQDELCIGVTCVTETELKRLLDDVDRSPEEDSENPDEDSPIVFTEDPETDNHDEDEAPEPPSDEPFEVIQEEEGSSEGDLGDVDESTDPIDTPEIIETDTSSMEEDISSTNEDHNDVEEDVDTEEGSDLDSDTDQYTEEGSEEGSDLDSTTSSENAD